MHGSKAGNTGCLLLERAFQCCQSLRCVVGFLCVTGLCCASGHPGRRCRCTAWWGVLLQAAAEGGVVLLQGVKVAAQLGGIDLLMFGALPLHRTCLKYECAVVESCVGIT